MRNKIINIFFIMIVGCFLSVTSYAQGNPVELLQNIANGMIAGLKTNQATLKTKPEIVYSLAYEYVVPHADLTEMAKRVLPPQVWNQATSEQRQQFKNAFTTKVIRTYASALTNYKDQSIKFYPVRGGTDGNTVEVNSEITSSQSQPIHVTYKLIRQGSSWKLFDMSVEGVNMLASFRAQFADILSQGDMNFLLARLSGKN